MILNLKRLYIQSVTSVKILSQLWHGRTRKHHNCMYTNRTACTLTMKIDILAVELDPFCNPDLELGSRVVCPYKHSRQLYLGTIIALNRKTCAVLFDDLRTQDNHVLRSHTMITTQPFVIDTDMFSEPPPTGVPTECYSCHQVLEETNVTCYFCFEIIHEECIGLRFTRRGPECFACKRCSRVYIRSGMDDDMTTRNDDGTVTTVNRPTEKIGYLLMHLACNLEDDDDAGNNWTK